MKCSIVGRMSQMSSDINLANKHTVFFNDYGHIKQVEVRIFVGGWAKDRNADIYKTAYYDMDHYDSEYEREQALEDIIETLEYYKEN